VLRLYRDLLALRRDHPAMAERTGEGYSVEPIGDQAILLRRRGGHGAELLAAINLGAMARVRIAAGLRPILNSEDARYGGRGLTRLEDNQLVFAGPGAVIFG
jgi:hypothetical protein